MRLVFIRLTVVIIIYPLTVEWTAWAAIAYIIKTQFGMHTDRFGPFNKGRIRAKLCGRLIRGFCLIFKVYLIVYIGQQKIKHYFNI